MGKRLVVLAILSLLLKVVAQSELNVLCFAVLSEKRQISWIDLKDYTFVRLQNIFICSDKRLFEIFLVWNSKIQKVRESASRPFSQSLNCVDRYMISIILPAATSFIYYSDRAQLV